jgi:hypothetical protein
VEGNYNGTKWPYNPVQGGDVHGNPSRIIDVVVGERSLYIKAQPQDWGHDGDLTISYMENLYVLEDDHIRVDNRFVDFSGWNHRYASQELPAFYTLSYFGDFTYYGGSKPWTDDTLSSRNDLKYWSGEYHLDCEFRMRESNTETWCAWTSSVKNYGIGLYVPGVDLFLAGRFGYNGSTSAQAGSTNYVAPLVMKKLVSYKPIEYSYLISTGSVEQIRATFAKYKDFASNSSLHVDAQSMRVADDTPVSKPAVTLDLTNAANLGSVTAGNHATVSGSSAYSAAELRATGDDTNVFLHLAPSGTLSTRGYGKLVIEYMIPTGNAKGSYQCDLFICAGSVIVPDPNCRVRASLARDGVFHRLEIDLSQYGFWMGNLNAIRFDFFDVAAVGDRMYLRSVTLQ